MTGNRRPDARACGLWATVAGKDHRIKVEAWARAVAAGEPVGTCRACGSYVVPDPLPAEAVDERMAWFMVRCLTCGHEAAAPGGRIGKRKGHIETRGKA